jgi:hypothetical protein
LIRLANGTTCQELAHSQQIEGLSVEYIAWMIKMLFTGGLALVGLGLAIVALALLQGPNFLATFIR